VTGGAPGGAAEAAPAAAPRRDRLAAFLRSTDVVCRSGCVWSWANPGHPGFPYPEAAALWLSWAAWRSDRAEDAPALEQRRRVAGWLGGSLTETGAIGKAGRLYLFDTCLAAHGLARSLPALPHLADAFRRSQDGIERFLDADRPVLPLASAAPQHWSDRWYGQHDRGGALLLQAGRLLGERRAVDLARRLRERTDDRTMEPAYVHSFLYGLEGELLYRALGEPPGAVDLLDAGRRLTALQTADGALPAWTDGTGGPRADATAQAVRLWCRLDAQRFAPAIDRALGFLAARQYEDGGVDYGTGRGDRTTWVALFADQATAWAEEGAESDWWL
jgi:hypothetical protein